MSCESATITKGRIALKFYRRMVEANPNDHERV
jgi:hypothetical protein